MVDESINCCCCCSKEEVQVQVPRKTTRCKKRALLIHSSVILCMQFHHEQIGIPVNYKYQNTSNCMVYVLVLVVCWNLPFILAVQLAQKAITLL
jgi:hypothetical protein